MKYHIAALQLNSSDNPRQNMLKVAQQLEAAARKGVKIVVLPEMWNCIGRADAMLAATQSPQHHEALQFLREKASEHKMWIVAGAMSWCEKSGSNAIKNVSRCFLIDDTGAVKNYYDKIHLFDVDVGDERGSYRESEHHRAGERVVVEATPFGKLGMAICYDLRFPELFRKMWQAGANVLVLPSAFTEKTGKAHWLPLLKARAIENSCFVIAANQSGEHADGRKTWGHSVIVDPWGRELASILRGVGLATAEIDLQRCEEIRRDMPCHLHQKIRII